MFSAVYCGKEHSTETLPSSVCQSSARRPSKRSVISGGVVPLLSVSTYRFAKRASGLTWEDDSMNRRRFLPYATEMNTGLDVSRTAKGQQPCGSGPNSKVAACWLMQALSTALYSVGMITILLIGGCVQKNSKSERTQENPTVNQPAPTGGSAQPAGQHVVGPDESADDAHWRTTLHENTLDAFQEYLFRYSAGGHAVDAKKRIDDMFADIERLGATRRTGKVRFAEGQFDRLFATITTKEGGKHAISCPLVLQDDGIVISKMNEGLSGQIAPVSFYKGYPFVCESVAVDNTKMFFTSVPIHIKKVESGVFLPTEGSEVPVRASIGLALQAEPWVCSIGVVWYFTEKDIRVRIGSHYYITQEPASSIQFTKYGVVIVNLRRAEQASPLPEKRADRGIMPAHEPATVREPEPLKPAVSGLREVAAQPGKPIQLLGIIARDGVAEAWMHADETTVRVRRGDTFELSGFTGTVTRIQDRQVEVRGSDGTQWQATPGGILQRPCENSGWHDSDACKVERKFLAANLAASDGKVAGQGDAHTVRRTGTERGLFRRARLLDRPRQTLEAAADVREVDLVPRLGIEHGGRRLPLARCHARTRSPRAHSETSLPRCL